MCACNRAALGKSHEIGEIEWLLERQDGVTRRLRHEPRMTCSDFAAVRAAAIADPGVALLPDQCCCRTNGAEPRHSMWDGGS
jgi:DNA-binding transcriptional LysR family regulator